MTQAPFGCGLEAVLNLVGGKWKLLILFHQSGNRRNWVAATLRRSHSCLLKTPIGKLRVRWKLP